MKIDFLPLSFQVFAICSATGSHLRSRSSMINSVPKKGSIMQYTTKQIDSKNRHLAAPTEYLTFNISIGNHMTHHVGVTVPSEISSLDVCLLQEVYLPLYPSQNKANWLKKAAHDIYTNVTAYVNNTAFAVAEFIDYNFGGHGGNESYLYKLLSNMSKDEAEWLRGIADLNDEDHGGDGKNGQYDAIVYAAGDDTNSSFPGNYPPCAWRMGPKASVRTMIVVTDSPFHEPHNHSGIDQHHINDHDSTVAALSKQHISVIGLTTDTTLSQLEDLATETGGSVQILESDGNNYTKAVMAGIEGLQPQSCDILSWSSTLLDDEDVLITLDPDNHSNVLLGSKINFIMNISVEGNFVPEQEQLNARIDFYCDEIFVKDVEITINLDSSSITTTTTTVPTTVTTPTLLTTPTPKSGGDGTKKVVHEITNTITQTQITETSETNTETIIEEEWVG